MASTSRAQILGRPGVATLVAAAAAPYGPNTLASLVEDPNNGPLMEEFARKPAKSRDLFVRYCRA